MPDIDDLYQNDSTLDRNTSFPEFDDLGEPAKARLMSFLQEVLLPPEVIDAMLYKSLVAQSSQGYADYLREHVYATFNVQEATKINFQERLAMAKIAQPIESIGAYLQAVELDIKHIETSLERFTKLLEQTQDDFFEDQDITAFPTLIDIANYALSLMKALQIIKTIAKGGAG